MKEVIGFYTHLANYLDENGFIKEAEDLTEKAIKTAQKKNVAVSPSLSQFEQLVNQDASKAADIVLKGMKGEISKESVKQELEAIMKKQESFKFNNKITENDETVLLNKMLKKTPQKQQMQTPVFSSVQQAENFYNQKQNFNSPQEAQKFQADKERFMKSLGR
jgi:DNA-binding transcriptional regulator YdaS (Cro superfamily)